MTSKEIGAALGKVAKKCKSSDELELGISDYLKGYADTRDFIISINESAGKKKKDKYASVARVLLSFRIRTTKNPLEFTSIELTPGSDEVVYG